MPIVVTGPKGETYTINNAGDPSKINQSDINAAIVAGASGVADPATMAIIHALLDNENWVEGATWSLKTLVEEAGKWAKPVGSGTDSEKKTQFQKIQEQYNDLKKALDEMEKARPALVSEEAAAAAGTDAKTKAEAALDSLDAAIAATKEQLVQLKNKALAAAAVESAISGDDSFKVFLATLGYKAPATPTKEGESGKTTIKTEPQPSAPPNGKAATGSGAYGATPPGSAVFGMPGFDTGFQASFDFSSWMQSSYFMDMQLDSMDAIGAEQLKSQKMLMLFYYFARMAMSGDLGAMYQFLRFVGIMINRDKAKDNIHMAHKLIELQVASRRLTDELIKNPAYDPKDQGVSAEFSKLMEKTKAEQGMIATDQKLIAQMLEEMSQVSEMMTGAVKALLDARGRELKVVSQWGF